jgi:hypothetical protein
LLPENRFDREKLVVTTQAPWIKGDFTASVLEQSGLLTGWRSMVDPTLAVSLGAAFGKSPWVSRVSVRVENRLAQVDLEFRRPVLCIPWNQEEGCYVSADGVALPVRDEAAEGWLRKCMTLIGIKPAGAPPAVGETFEDERVAAAARFAGIVDEYRDRLNLGAIVVRSPQGAPLECDLQTMADSIIKWGTTDLTPALVRRKLEELSTKAADAKR